MICGGLCPGLNNVIWEIVNTLIHLYDIGGKIYGVRGGYKGFYSQETPPIELTPTLVQDIHRQGVTYLGSSRGGFDIEKIMSFIEKKKINQTYSTVIYALHLKPNTVTYSIVINALSKSCEHRAAVRAEPLLSLMQKQHAEGSKSVKPDAETYNSVINACAFS